MDKAEVVVASIVGTVLFCSNQSLFIVMSRRANNYTDGGSAGNRNGNAVAVAGPPPSHPIEHNVEYRKFLIRSLDRCDTEFAALIRLNRALAKLKKSVVDICGESILLDIGQGLLTLSPTNDGIEGESVKLLTTNEQHQVCCDFLAHLKLRRRILNRVARRLNRVAHCMDGQDCSPPLPPKYGDFRLHVDAKAVQDYAEHWQRQEQAKQRIARSKHGIHTPPALDSVKMATPDPDDEDNDDMYTDADDEKAVISSTTTLKEDQKIKQPDSPSSTTPDATSSNADNIPDLPNDISIPSLQDDYALIREYKDAYQQVIDLTTGQATYSILLEEPTNDSEIRHGIGATNRALTLKEKELEFKRWQTSLLAKIPEQPTALELGLANRVFSLEQRRKALQEQQRLQSQKRACEDDEDSNEEDSDDDADEGDSTDDADDDGDGKPDKEVKAARKKGKDDDDISMGESKEDEDEEKDDDSDRQMKETKGTDKEMKDGDENGDGNKKGEEEAAPEKPALPIRIKPMSLVPIPSFYEQDMKRIRLIHADLIATSIHEHARRRIAEATNEYNHAFRTSSDLDNQRLKLQADLSHIRERHLAEVNKVKNDYTMQSAIARARWSKQKEAWEINKAKKAMHGMYGQMPVGTNRTQAASRHPNQIFNTVGMALGRVVDAVVMKVEGGLVDGEHFGEFTPPPPPNIDSIIVDPATRETFAQRTQRLENNARTQMQHLTIHLQKSEDDRKRAWRKFLKTKTDFDVPLAGHRRLDPSQISSIPLPPLRQSQAMPHSSHTNQPAPVPAYIPPTRTHNAAPPSSDDPNREGSNALSDSKYSAARVRERISSDGTVAPVSEPKRAKDGLFLRPAGRTRKGMNWDAVRGIWVPGYNN